MDDASGYLDKKFLIIQYNLITWLRFSKLELRLRSLQVGSMNIFAIFNILNIYFPTIVFLSFLVRT